MTQPARKVRHRVEAMRRHLRGKLLLGEPMARHTTLGVGGPADAYFVPEDREDLARGIRLCRELEVPALVVGNGSNLLVRDGGFRGVVVATTGLTSLSAGEPGIGGRVEVEAGAGLLMSRLLNFCVERKLGGLEWATGIPGTVGGAVAMNAGAYGASVADSLSWADVVVESGELARVPAADLGLGYRSSRLPGAVAAAGFALSPAEESAVLDRIKGLLQERGRKLPFGWMNAGSVFRNPPGEAAGRIIEELGFKGRRVGDAQVSPQHANVIVNLGKATARDVLGLMEEIARAARTARGVVLEPELVVVGEG